MDWITIISIVGIVGTWITIVLVYFTLREMRNQRIASQKPDLIIPKLTIYGYVDRKPSDNDSSLMITNWSDKEIDEESSNPVWPESTPIKLYNVGFGVAKNIELRWTVDYDKTIQQIKDYCYKNSVPIILESVNNRLHITGEKLPRPSEPFPSFISLLPIQYRHDFLMPASITSEGLESAIPFGIKELAAISAYLKTHFYQKHIPSGEEIENISKFFLSEQLEIDLPSIELELHYDDLENSHYTKSLRFFLNT